MPAPPGEASTLYAAFAVVGAAVPLRQLVPWFAVNGFDLPRLLAEAWAAPVVRFFTADVVVAALALIAFIVVEGTRKRVRGAWLAVVATLCIGVSCGLPLFLFLRERAMTRA